MKFFKKEIDSINGQKIQQIKFLNDNNYSIEFLNYGGYLHSISIPYKDNIENTEDVLLGYNDFDGYKNDTSCLNAIVGRVAGRIKNAKFELKGKTINLNQNVSPHHIHGGYKGFNKKIWKIEDIQEKKDSIQCQLSYHSTDLEENYPGNLDCTAIYAFNNSNELSIKFLAKTDQETIINLTNHNYWNFHGHKKFYQNILNHNIKINAEYFCETDKDLLPTGKLIKVNKKKYDFTNFKIIDDNVLKNSGIDICYEVNKKKLVKEIAFVYSKMTKMGLILYSDQPGLQFYTGNMMDEKYKGKLNRNYGHQYGLCFEPQLFPDAINHSNFISPILKANEEYSSSIIMKFKNDF